MIFLMFYKILWFFIFLVAMSTFFEIDAFFAVDFRFLCERCGLEAFYSLFAPIWVLLGVIVGGILINFA